MNNKIIMEHMTRTKNLDYVAVVNNGDSAAQLPLQLLPFVSTASFSPQPYDGASLSPSPPVSLRATGRISRGRKITLLNSI